MLDVREDLVVKVSLLGRCIQGYFFECLREKKELVLLKFINVNQLKFINVKIINVYVFGWE